MKTSLKQLGHLSEVLCGKGFWGHVVSNGMHVHICVCVLYEILALEGVGGYYKAFPPILPFPSHQVTLQPLNETTHTSKRPTTPLI